MNLEELIKKYLPDAIDLRKGYEGRIETKKKYIDNLHGIIKEKDAEIERLVGLNRDKNKRIISLKEQVVEIKSKYEKSFDENTQLLRKVFKLQRQLKTQATMYQRMLSFIKGKWYWFRGVR